MKLKNRFFFLCGIAMLSGELWKQWVLTFTVNHGSYDWWYFPFQLCSIPMYLCLAVPFLKNRTLKTTFLTFLKDFALLGGIFTFFDTSGMHYPLLSLTVFSYVWHILLIIIGIAAGYFEETDSSWHSYLNSIVCYIIFCAVATVINISVSPYGPVNMFYINPYRNVNQIVFRDIALYAGNPAGICAYIFCTLAGAGIIHFIWRIIKKEK